MRNPDKSKLSKRKNPTGILFFRAMGYLSEALINFLALLSNAAREGEDELMDLAAIVRSVSKWSTCRLAAPSSISRNLIGSMDGICANNSMQLPS